jgi:transcriptional regulator with XRE-family HTH domain
MALRTYPNITAYLRATGMTQAELAQRLGRSQPFVSKLINGLTQPTLHEALRIATICRIPVETLVTRESVITGEK